MLLSSIKCYILNSYFSIAISTQYIIKTMSKNKLIS